MPVDIDIPTHLNLRIDPKVRFLTDIAARVRGVSVTEYIEAALMESFRNVYPIEPPQSTTASLDERREHLAAPFESLAYYADALWSDNPGVRIAFRVGQLEHLMSEEEKIIFDYILRDKDLAPNGTLNQRAIADRWKEIKMTALSEHIESEKAKRKGDK